MPAPKSLLALTPRNSMYSWYKLPLHQHPPPQGLHPAHGIDIADTEGLWNITNGIILRALHLEPCPWEYICRHSWEISRQTNEHGYVRADLTTVNPDVSPSDNVRTLEVKHGDWKPWEMLLWRKLNCPGSPRPVMSFLPDESKSNCRKNESLVITQCLISSLRVNVSLN